MNTTQFPEIAKAVGAQRGGKYLKRVPKPGGGYRYVYKEEVGKKPAKVEEKAKAKYVPQLNSKLNEVRVAIKDGNAEAAWKHMQAARGIIGGGLNKEIDRVHGLFSAGKISREEARERNSKTTKIALKHYRRINALHKLAESKGVRVERLMVAMQQARLGRGRHARMRDRP